MRRVVIWLPGLILLLGAAACTAGGSSNMAFSISHGGQTYRDSAGWTVVVPRGWHAARFTSTRDGITAAGLQLSNVPLPAPSLLAGYPQLVNDRAFPARAVGLIIATDTDPKLSHGTVAVPALPPPWPGASGRQRWLVWSSAPMRDGPASPVYESLWFRVNGTTFLASAKLGAHAARSDLRAFAAIIESLR